MSTQVLAEYPEEGIAILRDGGGVFIFDRSDSILPVDDDRPLSLMTDTKRWHTPPKQSQYQDEEDEFYIGAMH